VTITTVIMALINTKKINYIAQLSSKAFKQYQRRFVLIIALGMLSGLSGGLGVGAVIPLFGLAAGGLGLAGGDDNAISLLIKSFFDFLHLPFSLPFLVAFIAALFVLKGIINFLTKYINDKTAAEYERTLRADLFDKAMHAGWPYLINQKLGYIERVIMNDIFISSRVVVHLSTMVLSLTTLTMYAVVALNISTPITLLTILLGGALVLIFKPLFAKTKQVNRILADTEKLTAHLVSESILGAKIVKASAVEDKILKKSHEHFNQLKKARIKNALYIYSVGSAFEPIGFIFVAVLFAFYFRSPGFNIIAFGAVVYLIQKIFAYVQAIHGSIHRVSEMSPYLQTVLDFRSLAKANREEDGGLSKFVFRDKLEFKEVRFSYDQKINIVSGVSFAVKKGEMIGLVGVSGAGKTTIADLLLRLFSPQSGAILMDGRPAAEFDLKSWRRKIGYVSQDVFLLNDTIKNNIKFYDQTITQEEVVKAAKAANIFDLIQKLPQGLETNIGERGLRLSGGQRQRIALARTLARQPEILILDEATSSLDVQSEVAIQKAIENLKGQVTVLAIAHRLSTVIKSDQLLVLEGGSIVESGSPATLLKDKDSHFYKMYNIR